MMSLTTRTAVFLGALLLAAAECALAQNQDDDPASGQDQGEQRQSRGPDIYPTLAAGLVEMGVPVIDVRSQAEIEETGTVAGAEHIPHTQLDAIAEYIGDDTNRAVVLYCGSGRRVGLVVDALRERGYHGMVNAGGLNDLRQALDGQSDG